MLYMCIYTFYLLIFVFIFSSILRSRSLELYLLLFHTSFHFFFAFCSSFFIIFHHVIFFHFLITLYCVLISICVPPFSNPLSPIPYLPSSALQGILNSRPIEIYSSDAKEFVRMKIDFDFAAVSQPPYENLHQPYRCFYRLL